MTFSDIIKGLYIVNIWTTNAKAVYMVRADDEEDAQNKIKEYAIDVSSISNIEPLGRILDNMASYDCTVLFVGGDSYN